MIASAPGEVDWACMKDVGWAPNTVLSGSAVVLTAAICAGRCWRRLKGLQRSDDLLLQTSNVHSP